MLDTRSHRDRQVGSADAAGLADPARSLLGAAQESWLFGEMQASNRAGTSWRLLGQQVMFAPITPPGMRVVNDDSWDGYQAARRRVLDFLATERVANVAILTGDIHSSWAMDVPREAVGAYRAASGSGSLAVELVTPAISSAPLFTNNGIRDAAPLLRLALTHVKYLEGDSRGYMLLNVTRDRLTADWRIVPGVRERSARDMHGARFVCERGSSRLLPG
jgi:alkaline phosphatase D